jgi:hypothetical protein
MYPNVTLNQYGSRPGEFFGSGSMGDLEELKKALDAGHITGRETTDLAGAGGAPLKVESLEKTLKHLTFKENDVTFWKRIPKKAAYNTVEEYNQLVTVGNEGVSGFYNEGELPQSEDTTYTRRAQLVKFLGVTKEVTHVMTLVNTMVGNVIEKEVKNGTLWILRNADRSLFFGDDKIIPQQFQSILGQQRYSDAFSSLDAYMNSDSVIDLRGAALDEDSIEGAANTIVENHGLGDQLYAPPKVLSNFVKGFYGNKFINPNTDQVSAGIMGQRVQAFDSQFGRIGLQHDIFFKKLPTKTTASSASSVNASAAPTIVSIAAVGSDVLGKWTSGDAGDYFYAVSALNRYGESALAPTAAATIVANGAVDLTFTATASPNAATGFRIYRSNKNAASAAAATFSPLFDVSAADLTAGFDGGAAGKVRDRNRWLPGTDQAFLVQEDEEVIEFAQLAPLMKMDLAILSPAYRFMLLMYGTPFLYAPKKIVRIINIGNA